MNKAHLEEAERALGAHMAAKREAAELQRQEAEAFRAIQANRYWRICVTFDGGWDIRDPYGMLIAGANTLLAAIQAARLAQEGKAQG